MALSYSCEERSLRRTHSPQIVREIRLLCRFVLLSFRRFVFFRFWSFRHSRNSSLLSFCSTFVRRFVAFGFVVLYLKQMREPRGALLFAPKEETCDEINRRKFLLANSFGIRIIFSFYLPVQEIRNPLSRRHV